MGWKEIEFLFYSDKISIVNPPGVFTKKVYPWDSMRGSIS